jgi:phage FluMu protein Com
MRCDFCNSYVIGARGHRGECPSCLAYNAAVAAQKTAATAIAKAFDHRATGAWLNEYGVVARLRGKHIQIASADIAAPFVALTTAARQVKFPHGHCWDSGDGVSADVRAGK